MRKTTGARYKRLRQTLRSSFGASSAPPNAKRQRRLLRIDIAVFGPWTRRTSPPNNLRPLKPKPRQNLLTLLALVPQTNGAGRLASRQGQQGCRSKGQQWRQRAGGSGGGCRHSFVSFPALPLCRRPRSEGRRTVEILAGSVDPTRSRIRAMGGSAKLQPLPQQPPQRRQRRRQRRQRGSGSSRRISLRRGGVGLFIGEKSLACVQ